MSKVIIIIGVSGVGKSTISKLLSHEISIPYFDADNFHPKENIEKMARGEALNDTDREGWLQTLNKLIKTQQTKEGCIIACSALKQSYRDHLASGVTTFITWVHLKGSFNQILDRLKSRTDHFMPTGLLQSQFETLEVPKYALPIDISLSPEEIVNIIKDNCTSTSSFGLFGLGVMGKSLCRNLASKGFKISMFNRHVDSIEEHVAKHFKDQNEELNLATPFDDIASFVNSLARPRKIMLMVNAGKTVDIVIEDLIPHLDVNDVIIDGGNSNYLKTNERCQYLKGKGIHFIGAGVSGGEEGALRGPSIMPSGAAEAYKTIQPYLEAIAAKDKDDKPCCAYIGPEGSGHFVKMVHNGIEYVEMQLLAEVSSIFESSGKNLDEIATLLENWKTEVDSYLLNITVAIFRKKESDDWLVKKILDKAANKGTGNWATIATAQLGVPSTLIAAALFARYTSSNKKERIENNDNFRSTNNLLVGVLNDEVLQAYQFARIINHYQGLKLIAEASASYSWDLNLSEIARIWTNGCIIKSTLLQDLVPMLKDTQNILNNPTVMQWIKTFRPSANKVVCQCVAAQISVPCLSESVQFFNGITTANSSANIIQAQRDYFGAHTYKRIDDDTGKNYHSNWN